MSVYSVYCGNVGFGDPIEIHHFLATGVAASNLLANYDALRALTGSLKGEGGACLQPPAKQDSGEAPAAGSGSPADGSTNPGTDEEDTL